MKTGKKVFAMLLALVMILGLGVTAFAADPYSIKVENKKADTNISITGKTFNAYKIFDVTSSGKAYAYTIDSDADGSWFAQVTAYMGVTVTESESTYNGKGITLARSASDKTVYNVTTADTFSVRNFADYLGKYLNSAASKPAYDGTGIGGAAVSGVETAAIAVTAPGYYLVTGAGAADGSQEVVAAAALSTAAPEAKVDMKAEAPTIDKVIVEDGKDVDHNNAAIGDMVNYKITSAVPDMTGYSKYFFVVNDTLSSGLTMSEEQWNGLAVKIGNDTLTKGTDYTAAKTENPDGTTALKIVFDNFVQYKEQKGTLITITYAATVDEDAVIGTAGNKNDVTLTYSNNPNVTPAGENEPNENDPKGETPKSEVRTYVTGIQLTKVDNAGNRLTGAKFQLTGTKLNQVLVKWEEYTEDVNGAYWKLKDGTYTTTAPAAGSEDQYDSTTTKYKLENKSEIKTVPQNVKAEGIVGSDGVIRFDGLAAGNYQITELEAPDGYNLLTSPISLTINWTAPTGANTDCTWTVIGDAGVSNNGIITMNVENQAGGELPSTGGIGTTIFYVVGGILAVGAAILLITKKRMSRFED